MSVLIFSTQETGRPGCGWRDLVVGRLARGSAVIQEDGYGG
jgi:hypothetical protein